ncbi:MAG: transglutaminase family protein [Myxococcota bacterium]|jgi:uncharacterized protein (DUF2126 family)|nr:transglutaminase family protein [Myxococcota bacterium]
MPVTSGFDAELRRAIAAHDARVREAGLELWLGAEPTFTDPTSSDSEWIGAAVGGTKEARAIALWVALHERTAPSARRATERPRTPDARAGASGDARIDTSTDARASEPPLPNGRRQLALRTLGRQYPGEDAPRFSLGLYALRDGTPLCPATFEDPAFVAGSALHSPRARELRDALALALGGAAFDIDGALPHRLVVGTDPRDARCLRAPLEGRAIPESGLVDELAMEGFVLVCVGVEDTPRGPCTVLELPGFASARGSATKPSNATSTHSTTTTNATKALEGFGSDVDAFLRFLATLAEACRTSGTRALILRGFPPPVDARVRFATLTPDPGVVEVNMAPCTELSDFAAQVHAIHEAAHDVGLAAERRHFNGELSDSGGGGHLTFGGPSTGASPFFRFPTLLPKLVAYLNQHPSLSYYFGGHAAGSASQSPRADESARELFGELQLTLARLVRAATTASATPTAPSATPTAPSATPTAPSATPTAPSATPAAPSATPTTPSATPTTPTPTSSTAPIAPTPGVDPSLLWSSLAPFLADRFGNSHRSEINVEKLFNPWLPGRGKLGVIELRAFRQAPTSAHAIARAALFRAILARLATSDFPITLCDFGAELHDRYALPFFLENDLREVLGDLERAGFALPSVLAQELFRDPHRVLGEVELGDPNAPVTLTVRRAIEHWPLVGDLSEQAGTTRLVDPSTTRLEVRVTGPSERVGRVIVGVRDGDSAVRAPTTFVDDGARSTVVVGVRFRAFVPTLGLHPSLPARDPLELVVSVGERSYALALHAWIPGGGVYPGLPETDEEATRRRLRRFVVEARKAPTWTRAPSGATTRHTIDARWW